MKLFYSPTSPFVRKVMATAIAVGAENQIEKVKVSPAENPPALHAANPLGKIPCLLTVDGLALFDSPVICEYIDATFSGTLFPAGAARWRALKQQAIGDGIMDAAVLGRGEQNRPQDDARKVVVERQRRARERSLAALEADLPADHLDIGTITVACALGYLDLRFAEEPWRPAHPKLAAWFDRMSARPELKDTAPPPA